MVKVSRAGFRADRGAVECAAAGRACQHRLGDLPAAVVKQTCRRSVRSGVFVSPLSHGREYGPYVSPLGGKAVVVSRGVFAVGGLLEDSGVNQCSEALVKNVAADA